MRGTINKLARRFFHGPKTKSSTKKVGLSLIAFSMARLATGSATSDEAPSSTKLVGTRGPVRSPKRWENYQPPQIDRVRPDEPWAVVEYDVDPAAPFTHQRYYFRSVVMWYANRVNAERAATAVAQQRPNSFFSVRKAPFIASPLIEIDWREKDRG